MDSINRNQPEDTRDNLQGTEAVAKIKEIVGKTDNCFFNSPGPTRRGR